MKAAAARQRRWQCGGGSGGVSSAAAAVRVRQWQRQHGGWQPAWQLGWQRSVINSSLVVGSAGSAAVAAAGSALAAGWRWRQSSSRESSDNDVITTATAAFPALEEDEGGSVPRGRHPLPYSPLASLSYPSHGSSCSRSCSSFCVDDCNNGGKCADVDDSN